MPSTSTPRAPRFVLAAAMSAAFVLSAPYIGQLRSAIRTRYPGHYVQIVGGLVGLLVAGALGTALARIRNRRLLRYGSLLAALTIAAVYSRWRATGRPDVDVVELFHFVEYGLVTWLFYRAWRPLDDGSIFLLPVLAGLLVGTLEEWLQWFIPARVGEMNDVLLNLAAIACGLLFSIGVDPPDRLTLALRPGSLTRLGRLAAVVLVVFAAFFHVVHLGYFVEDPTIGLFSSRYSKETLLGLDVEKREEWRARPLPLTLRRVSREDQFMSEGVVHVQERNEQLSAGHVAAAWLENLILERYFSSVLDAPSYVSHTGHRWSPQQREQIGSQASLDPLIVRIAAGGERSPYVSDAYPYPIYAWPRRRFWIGAAALAGLIVVASAAVDRRRRE